MTNLLSTESCGVCPNGHYPMADALFLETRACPSFVCGHCPDRAGLAAGASFIKSPAAGPRQARKIPVRAGADDPRHVAEVGTISIRRASATKY